MKTYLAICEMLKIAGFFSIISVFGSHIAKKELYDVLWGEKTSLAW